MTATYTFDIFSSLDAFGSYGGDGDWGGYWGKQGPELLARREELFAEPQHMVFGATTIGEFVQMLSTATPDSEVLDSWVGRMRSMPTTVISSTLSEPLNWPDASVASGDAVELVSELKRTSDVPLRSHGSLTLNRSLLDAGLVDFVQVTLFPVLTGRTGESPIWRGAGDFDLDLISSRLLDGRTHELTYRPTIHGPAIH